MHSVSAISFDTTKYLHVAFITIPTSVSIVHFLTTFFPFPSVKGILSEEIVSQLHLNFFILNIISNINLITSLFITL